MDPESAMAIGQDAGLIISLKENGFDFFINYKELIIDQKSDFIGRGGYGDVYKAKWMGTKVAVKRFGKRYLTKKALKDFIKEIEMLHQLRHPNVVMFFGIWQPGMEAGEDRHRVFLVMELCPNGDLQRAAHHLRPE